MGFSLPVYQDLSIEQDRINNLPLSGTHLVTGPPGTGKTVLAIYRCLMFERQGISSTFVVYNNVLNWYLQQALHEVAPSSTTTTFHKFFKAWYLKQFSTNPPLLPPSSSGFQDFDWEAITTSLIKSGGKFEKVPHLVLDEGQDFHPALYPALPLIAENLTIFADENQKLNDSNSLISEIVKALGLRKVHELRRNYRNSKQIAEFSRQFYAGGPTGIPDPPTREGTKPWLIRYPSLAAQADAIAQYEQNNPEREIGVLVPYKNQQVQLRDHLKGKTTNPVQMYASGIAPNPVDFKRPGIRLLNHMSSKGLEFDTLFLPLMDSWKPPPHQISARMRMYVLASRARNDLRITYSGNQLPAMLQGLSSDLYQVREIG